MRFSYLGGKTYKCREYSRNFALVSKNLQDNDSVAEDSNAVVSSVTEGNKSGGNKTVGVLCIYYTWDDTGTLNEDVSADTHKFYLNISNYRATLSDPTYENGSLHINVGLVTKLEEFIGTFS